MNINNLTIQFINVAHIMLGVVGAVTLLFFIYGGLLLLVSSGNQEYITKGKSVLINSMIGLVLVFGSSLIVQWSMQSFGVVDEEGKFIEQQDFRGRWDKLNPPRLRRPQVEEVDLLLPPSHKCSGRCQTICNDPQYERGDYDGCVAACTKQCLDEELYKNF